MPDQNLNFALIDSSFVHIINTIENDAYVEDEETIAQVVQKNEHEWNSISDIKGLAKNIFLYCGNWHQIGRMIQSSSISTVKNCCEEIKNDLLQLITHHKACHSLATLFFNCDDTSWNHLLRLLENETTRSQLYDSLEAGRFFRKMMTNESFRQDRYLNLSVVFKVHEIISKRGKTQFFECMASRPGPAAIDLANFARSNVSFVDILTTNLFIIFNLDCSME